ncbi:hypothetical protein Aduo_006513 [Ancylostoma duodenale]
MDLSMKVALALLLLSCYCFNAEPHGRPRPVDAVTSTPRTSGSMRDTHMGKRVERATSEEKLPDSDGNSILEDAGDHETHALNLQNPGSTLDDIHEGAHDTVHSKMNEMKDEVTYGRSKREMLKPAGQSGRMRNILDKALGFLKVANGRFRKRPMKRMDRTRDLRRFIKGPHRHRTGSGLGRARNWLYAALIDMMATEPPEGSETKKFHNMLLDMMGSGKFGGGSRRSRMERLANRLDEAIDMVGTRAPTKSKVKGWRGRSDEAIDFLGSDRDRFRKLKRPRWHRTRSRMERIRDNLDQELGLLKSGIGRFSKRSHRRPTGSRLERASRRLDEAIKRLKTLMDRFRKRSRRQLIDSEVDKKPSKLNNPTAGHHNESKPAEMEQRKRHTKEELRMEHEQEGKSYVKGEQEDGRIPHRKEVNSNLPGSFESSEHKKQSKDVLENSPQNVSGNGHDGRGRDTKENLSSIPMCSSSHKMFVKGKEKDGCVGASDFANAICGDYSRCIQNNGASDSQCRPKICDKFKSMPRNKNCFNDLFSCD